MTGANYTGGKRWVSQFPIQFFLNRSSLSRSIRNFARARFRDTTRRAQKNHFGRRRLEILSRSLGNGAQSKEEPKQSSGITGILLEHAQREFSRPPEYMRSTRTEAPDTFSCLSSPFISEHGIKPSKVVHTLDSKSRKSLRSSFFSLGRVGHFSKDPSLRAEVNRVLEFSRTVGLCNYPSSSRRQSGSTSPTSDVDSESRVGATSLHPTLAHRDSLAAGLSSATELLRWLPHKRVF